MSAPSSCFGKVLPEVGHQLQSPTLRCGDFGIGTQLRGQVSEHNRYLRLFVPDKKGKLKSLDFKITQMGNAETVQ
jgi:hypothetical protein